MEHAPVIRKAFFRFYEELNEHLPFSQRKKVIEQKFTGKPAIKNIIESMGIPHSEIDLIIVNGQSVDFNYHLKGDENISVYPVFETLDISPLIRLRPKPLRKTKFIVDVNLGKLAQKLRLLGFDTLFRNDFKDDEIITIAAREKRIILTRDKGILTQNKVTHGYWLRNDNPKKQLSEVVGRLQLKNSFNPFVRCSVCNSELKEITYENVSSRLPGDTLQYYDKFWECSGCGKLYWKGSHYKHITKLIDNLKQAD
jgi:uncharacterized protein with PIN domain